MADWDFQEVVNLASTLTRRGNQIEKGAEVILAKTAQDVKRDAKLLAPVDTGNLKGSVDATGGGLEYEIAPTAGYAIYQELGTSTQAAQPFMGPAIERNTPSMIAAFEELAGGRWNG